MRTAPRWKVACFVLWVMLLTACGELKHQGDDTGLSDAGERATASPAGTSGLGGAGDVGQGGAQAIGAAAAAPVVGGTTAGDVGGAAPEPFDFELRPLAPRAGDWMWQGQQRRLGGADGYTCDAKIALAVGPVTACFTDSAGELECAGTIDTHTYGPGFQKVGLSGADQILLAPIDIGGAICVHTLRGTIECMGAFNTQGQFGNGTSVPSPTFVTWGLPDLVAVATGTWDQMCALAIDGRVSCSGFGFGLDPVPLAGASHQSVWIDTFGTVIVDDAEVVRAGESRTECTIKPKDGLVCQSAKYGEPGHVVSGGLSIAANGSNERRACWLNDSGHAECASDPVAPFGESVVLALASSYYAKRLCAVLLNGAVACTSVDSSSDEPSAPPGSAFIGCD